MKRVIILMMDSFGVGAAPDAASFGDQGSDTLGHIADACAQGNADVAHGRSGPLVLPNLTRWGLARAAAVSAGRVPAGMDADVAPEGLFGCAAERSKGKDTPSGHWEMAGVPVMFDWGYFPRQEPCFPEALIADLVARGNLPGVLGNKHASGTEIIEELGAEHIRTGRPIVYTSADSVFQIAAHEGHFGLQRLYDLCVIARDLVDGYNVGRVIARPFVGESPETFTRTGNRKDLSTPPPAPTVLDRLVADDGTVIAVGKIGDIYAHQGISRVVKATGNMALFDATLSEMETAPDRSIVFTNFVDFDSSFGHRRNVAGYANALEEFDRRLPELESVLRPGDLVLVTADHGCDPTWEGTDHTRENVPVLAVGEGITGGSIGHRESFADIGQSIAAHLDMAPLDNGVSFLPASHKS